GKRAAPQGEGTGGNGSVTGFKKKSRGDLGGRGRLTSAPDRSKLLLLVDEAMQSGARQSKCAEVLGLSLRTLKRWRHNHGDDRPTACRPTPPNALTAEEHAEILRLCNEPGNASKPPAQIVVELADQHSYVASEASFY